MTQLAESDRVEPVYLPVVVVTIRSANSPSQRGFIAEETVGQTVVDVDAIITGPARSIALGGEILLLC